MKLERHDTYDALLEFIEWCEEKEIFPAKWDAKLNKKDFLSWAGVIGEWESEVDTAD